MAGVISIVISQSAMDYILNQEINKDKLFVVLAQEVPVEAHKPIEEELGKLEKKYREKETVIVVRVICKTSPEFIENYKIKAFPTVFFIKDKVKVDEHVGLDPKPIEEILRKYIKT